jgi:hypothetical protein
MRFLARNWFALALAALLILALPAAGLFALNLFNLDGPVNSWLQRNYHVSYTAPLPGWATVLLLLVPPLLILLYFLKLRRKPIQVPSTFLWKKSVEDLRVNSLFQWLRNNVLLLLQLLAVLVLLYALLGPRLFSRGQGRHYIVMIDNSASMQATDVGPNRLAEAKRLALEEIDAAGDEDVGMVIAFNSTAEIRRSFTANKAELRRAVEQVEPTDRPTRLDEALSLAGSRANPERSSENQAVAPPAGAQQRTYVANEGLAAEVHLFSDGRFPEVPDFALGNLNVHFHPVGRPGAEAVNNVGLVTFSARRDEENPRSVQVLATVGNFGPRPVEVRVELEVAPNAVESGRLAFRPVEERRLTVPPRTADRRPAGEPTPAKPAPGGPTPDRHGEASVTFDVNDLPPDTVLHARLLNTGDDLARDDEAWLVLGGVRKAQVLVVGPDNPVLHAFFDEPETRAVADVSYLSAETFAKPDEYRARYLQPAQDGAFDLVVFDRCAPPREEDLPRGNTFFIGRPPPPWDFAKLPKVQNPFVRGWMSQSPIMQGLTGLYDVGVAEAFRIEDLPPRTPRLMESERDLVLLMALPRQSFTDLVLAFPLERSNWPVQASFPLFLINVLYTLGNVTDAVMADEPVTPGRVKVLRPAGGVKAVRVTGPAGNTLATLDRGTRADFSFGETDRVGPYRADGDGGYRRYFAVNLLDPEESNLEPRTDVRIGSERVGATAPVGRAQELWKWALAAALGLLLLEWVIYHRRVAV